MLRKMYKFHLGKVGCRHLVLGETNDDINTFTRRVLEDLPDLVILDQNIESPTLDQETVYGSDVAESLRAAGYGKVIIICTATPTAELRDLVRRNVINHLWTKGNIGRDTFSQGNVKRILAHDVAARQTKSQKHT